MEVIDLLDPISTACAIDLEIRDAGLVDRAHDDRIDREFSATLLAMAGHDLRHPLRILAGAHNMLAGLVDREAEREALARAEDATAQLTGILGQLIEALYRRRPSCDALIAPVPLRPILDSLAAEFGNAARLKGLTFLVAVPCGAVFSHPVLLTGMLRNLIRQANRRHTAGRRGVRHRPAARRENLHRGPRHRHEAARR
jgi:signal transduction histidine kinase